MSILAWIVRQQSKAIQSVTVNYIHSSSYKALNRNRRLSILTSVFYTCVFVGSQNDGCFSSRSKQSMQNKIKKKSLGQNCQKFFRKNRYKIGFWSEMIIILLQPSCVIWSSTLSLKFSGTNGFICSAKFKQWFDCQYKSGT